MPLADAVDQFFAADGPLASALPGFEPRPAQREMARAVADVLERGGVLLAEAGTGTGKTLAYLVPALLKREPVIVSTGTKNLQEQIIEKDVPLLRKALGVPFTATCMKGRSNYLCLHRFDAVRQHAAEAGTAALLPGVTARVDVGSALERIAAWSATTETGDRAELIDLPDDIPLWNEIAASADTCLGTECPRYHECFVTRMRQRAAESDVVVVNHHLLFADAAVRQRAFGEVIPEIRHAVLDEAHALEDVATQYFGITVSTYRVEELSIDIERWAATHLHDQPRDAVASGAGHVRRHARRLFLGLDAARPGPDERVRLTGPMLEKVGEDAAALDGTLEGLAAALQLVRQGQSGDEPLASEALDDLSALTRRTLDLRDDLRFLLRASDADYVYFLEVRGRGVFLRAAPIDVASIVRETVLERRDTTVLASATLAVGGSFEYVRRRLGIGRADEIALPSEFDYRRQALLYLPRRMPSPKAPEFADAALREICDILLRTRGRAFVLFTSYAMLRRVRDGLSRSLPFPLYVQGEAPRAALLDRFRTTPNAVLLATASFWQGVDVVGEALSCVIIDKLPFASPGDPITAARLEAATARGEDAFGDYQVPLAILALLQGLGRLLRHQNDRGVLAILDPRLRTMAYGRRFLESLPPAPVTMDPRDIERFFG